jgi:glycosyltransferase involved in cell wall biosynthesis
VVIPTYNRPEFLPGAIETVLGQTYETIEILVVDDGSEEDYATSIIGDRGDERIRLETHETNKGLSAARNTGIEMAEGEYIAFLDDDDRWHEEKLERQVAAFTRRNDVGLVSCCVASVSPDNEILRTERSKPTGDLSDEIFRKNIVGSPSRVIVSRECIEDIGTFDESLPTKQDWDLYIRIAQDWRIETLQEALCYRTVHPSMSSDPSDTERDLMRIRERYEDTIRERGMWDTSMAHYHTKVGVTYLFQGHRRKGRDHIRKAIAHDREPFHVPLYVMTYLPHALFERAIDVKRAAERLLADPESARFDPAVVPGSEPGTYAPKS